jgi:hypothetical protein
MSSTQGGTNPRQKGTDAMQTNEFHYHNDRLRDLLRCKEQQDEFEFRMLKDHMDRYVANRPALANYLAQNPQYDHSDVSFDA